MAVMDRCMVCNAHAISTIRGLLGQPSGKGLAASHAERELEQVQDG